MALCPDAKPMSVEEFLTRATPEDEDMLAITAESQADYEAKMKEHMQRETYVNAAKLSWFLLTC